MVPAWQQALGVLVLTHEAFHLRHWRFRRNEGKVECQALVCFRDPAAFIRAIRVPRGLGLRAPRSSGFRVAFVFRVKPAAGARLKAICFYNDRWIGEVAKPRQTTVGSFVRTDGALPKRWVALPACCPPHGRPVDAGQGSPRSNRVTRRCPAT
jgi:hypothetical protein